MKFVEAILIVFFVCACSTNSETYEEYHSNGVVSLTGIKSNGIKIGKWTEFNSEGVKMSERIYDSGLLVKRYIYTNNYLYADEDMNGDGVKDGLTITYYANGQISSECTFVNNMQFGKQVFYFENGQIDIKYIDSDSGIYDFEQYYPNGNLMMKGKKMRDGVISIYDSSGVKLHDILYKDDVLIDTLK